MHASGRRVLRAGTVAIVLSCLGAQPDSNLAVQPDRPSALAPTDSPRDDAIVDLLLAAPSRPDSGRASPGRHDRDGLPEQAAPPEATVTRRRLVAIERGALDRAASRVGVSLRFELFDDVRLIGVVERIDRPPAGGTVIEGSISTHDGHFTLVRVGDTVVANIRSRSHGSFQIRKAGHRLVEVRQIDETQFSPCGGAGTDPSANTDTPQRAAQNCTDDGSVIDLLVVYTKIARIKNGGSAAMNALIALAEAETNQAYANSLIETRVRVLLTHETDYGESGALSVDRGRLANTSDGYMDEAHVLRDLYGADVITLLVHEGGQLCGIAYFSIGPGNVANQSLGVNVTKVSCATGNFTFGHELGHNQGCLHDWESDGSSGGAFYYSHGYVEPSRIFRTYMGTVSAGGPRVAHFSNPNVLYAGIPTGIPTSEPFPSNNARTIDETSFNVANFRVRDCNGNGICDDEDIAIGGSLDCSGNAIPDECEPDCDGNGVADSCDILAGAPDCNLNGVPDVCEDCDGDGLADECDIAVGQTTDCNVNGIPDECEAGDCNGNGINDMCDLPEDCNANGRVDYCDIALDPTLDVNENGVLDACDRIAYVDSDAEGTNDGTSWANAYRSLQSAALYLPGSSISDGTTELWVARGVYQPIGAAVSRNASIWLKSGRIYGGFAGGETKLTQRNPDPTANDTILDGESGVLGLPADNLYHVIVVDNGSLGPGAAALLLDGFTIRNGHADIEDGTPFEQMGGGMYLRVASSAIVANCRFMDNYAQEIGGGIGGRDVDSLTVDRCLFINNRTVPVSASGWGDGGGIGLVSSLELDVHNSRFLRNQAGGGGGISASVDRLTALNCLFSGNRASDDEGGGLRVFGSQTAQIVNSTFANNFAQTIGGGFNIRVQASGTIINSILWDNRRGPDQVQDEIAQVSVDAYSDLIVRDSIIEGLQTFADGNIGDDPLFVDSDGADDFPGTLDDNLRIPFGSPAIDAGGLLPGFVIAIPRDLDGHDRVAGGRIDIGPYEFDDACGDGTCGHDETSCTCPGDCGGPAVSEIPGVTCSGGIDDDCDGVVDCFDPDCFFEIPCCGDLSCELGETPCSCPQDCGLPFLTEDPSTECADGLDNDCDGLPDCADGDCAGVGLCCGDGICSIGEDACICELDCGPPAANEIQDATCLDGLDNDCDGDADCNDSDCQALVGECCGDDACEYSEQGCRCVLDCGLGTVTEDPVTLCDDGIDNDCDGDVDCEDADCLEAETCCGNGFCAHPDDPCRCVSDCFGGAVTDCNGNGIPDDCEIESGDVTDCNANAVPDDCDIAGGGDTNQNGLPDECDRVFYVDASAVGANNGSSWGNAYTTLDAALARTLPTQQTDVWVAAGTYLPGGNTPSRASTFEIRGPARVYGGFAGGETSFALRDPETNLTTLSGDIGVTDNRVDNVYHVVVVATDAGAAAPTILDGFTITGGNASGAATIDQRGGGLLMDGSLRGDGHLRIRRCRFTGNWGGAYGGGALSTEEGVLHIRDSVFEGNSAMGSGGAISRSRLTIELRVFNSIFVANQADGGGGAIYTLFGPLTIANCLFSGNDAANRGGALYGQFSNSTVGDATFVNCTFWNNHSAIKGGGLYFNPGYPTRLALANSIFWANSDPDGVTQSAQLGIDWAKVSHCNVQGWNGAMGGRGNIGLDPLFADPAGADGLPGTADDDLRLTPGSPSHDTGDFAVLPFGLSFDLDGNARTVGTIDMGAYEVPIPPDCSASNDCSGHGICIADETCECEPGWLPADCAAFTCADLADCNGNGTCVGPNECACFEPYGSPSCGLAIPAAGTWGLTILALGMCVLATLSIRRRQPA